ncbi:hypothetical protein [Acidovorax sp. SUPP2539]|uniref:hypothetical protein n=1 Tax=Acidovorax sp. SUPP2539 TaxID=2920878 RepID=UPI0023DE22DC|nr:hypothetical protein [Acidovorax sp. SUPP2539]GKS90751.1 hypothetical protein AVTE2539_15320 [Acidovorax sp. SUPP2539]
MTFSLPQGVEDRVRRDLAAFADSRTQIEFSGNEFRWTLKRTARVLKMLELGDSDVPTRVEFEGQEFTYPDFFASEQIGALAWLAEEIERSLAILKSSYPTEIIPAKVRVEDKPDVTTFGHALSDIAAADTDRTSLVFLQGRAGDGKSTSLVDLAQKQAADYAARKIDFLYLYIDAQGRALSRLDEAVALILDDLNSNFRYQSLAVLTRLGLVVPVVDGFDELLGSGGYAEAFASLEAFLFRLEGHGTVVTSARSTFYQQSALSRAAARLSGASTSVNIVIHNIHLLPWDREATQQLLKQLGAAKYLLGDSLDPRDTDLYEAAAQHIGVGADEILSSPLLTGAYASLLAEQGISHPSGSVVEAAIRALVQREIKDKLLGAHGDQILNERQFEQLFAAVAEEMWWQETRTLDDDTLLVVADITLEQLGIDKSKAGALLGKLSSNAVIELGEGARKLSFRHEIYFSFFLGNYFKNAVLTASRKELARLISRSVLPATLARQCAWLLQGGVELNRYLGGLAASLGESAASDLINTNRGALIGGVLRHSQEIIAPLTVSQAIFSATDLSGVQANGLVFQDCRFDEVDMTGMEAPTATFRGCSFHMPLVDEATNLNFKGLRLGEEIIGLRVRRGGQESTLYRTAQDKEFLERLGLRDAGSQPVRPLGDRELRVLDTVQRVVRLASRSMYFSEEDLENRKLPRDILPIGAKHRIWAVTDKQRSGMRALYRLNKAPESLIAGATGGSFDADVVAFWEDMFKLY